VLDKFGEIAAVHFRAIVGLNGQCGSDTAPE